MKGKELRGKDLLLTREETMSDLTALNSYVKFKHLTVELKRIIKLLQDLRKCGKTDKEIEAVIHEMRLPLKAHLFILANYSNLMELRVS